MTLSVSQITPNLGAEILGVDLTAPVDDGAFGQIAAAFEAHSMLVFRDQQVTDAQQIAFSRRFGPLEVTVKSVANWEHYSAEIVELSNVDAQGRIIPPTDRRMVYNSGNMMWHSDSSFKRVPALASLLSGREVVSEGGETEFASMRAAYAALPAAMQSRLEGLVAEHSLAYSRGLVAPDLLSEEQNAQLPPVTQAVVRVNPVNERKSLFVGSHASHIIGMPIEDGRALLRELLEFATQPQFVYPHRWRRWDLVMWDNRCVLHRGRPWDETRRRRVMRRTTVAGDGPTA